MEEILPGRGDDVLTFDHIAWIFCALMGQQGHGWVAPQIPQPVLASALTNYLSLADDETLLAIVGKGPTQSCALTTKRIYWAGDPRRDEAEWDDADHPDAQAIGRPPLRCEYIAYKDLPEAIDLTGALTKVIDLGEGRQLNLGPHIPLLQALIGYLKEVRSIMVGEKPLPHLVPAAADQTRSAWPAVVAADAEARTLQAAIRGYHSQTLVAKRAVVTPLMAAACVLVYVAMVARGVSPINPTPRVMLEWGASFGPSVVFDGQAWRLLTSMFLHFGLIHLAMNLWCLLTTGPVVERFFGHLGFAALYVLAGLGGAAASLFVHPTFICAGASGAIFGVFGGLLGFLAIRHRDVPPAILQPMRSGTLGFLAYNVLFGLTSPTIDMAAHLGGLATGFVVGLVLADGRINRPDRVGLMRRVGVIAVLSVGLFVLTRQTIERAHDRILADPTMGPQLESALNAGPAWNAFQQASAPLFQEFDRISRATERVMSDIDQGVVPASQIEPTLNRLSAESESLGRRLETLPVGNPELQAMVDRLSKARTHQHHALILLSRFFADKDASLLKGPDGLDASFKAYIKELEEFRTLRDAYFKTHQLTLRKP
ncbi:rhomboid protease GluP [Singulisphaera sp. GP187]|uniref:rhomboid family intramembrane serine protease n=1 Tax=Singulisphaera sp. GP187 TaxID=1882752 RepID=UPI000927B27D|nr:rhomboid family intramembrane serine protease [Singulisphaera sp. GP187]SIO41859.1 rhomboid protease GluP [Singulisphaera sp. GP187]